MDQEVKVTSRVKASKAISQISITAICLALAMLLNVIFRSIPGLSFPNGGSVSLIYIPLALCALYCGPIWGLFIGCAYGILDVLVDGGFAINWISLLCDYIFSYIGTAFVGFLSPLFLKKRFYTIPLSLILIGIFRVLMTFISGCTIWSQASIDAGTLVVDFSAGAIIYSLSYNSGYILPGVALSLLVFAMLTKPIFESFKLPVINKLNDYKPETDTRKFSADTISNMDLLPAYFAALLILVICALIPSFQVYFLSYISLIGALVLTVYCSLNAFKAKKMNSLFSENDYLAFFKKPSLLYFVSAFLFVIILILSIVAICLYFI